MPNPFFERQPIDNALAVSREIAKVLAKRKAVVYPPGKEGGQEIISLIQPHVLPTINMIHEAHDHCVFELERSPLLDHVRTAYQTVLRSSSPPEDDAAFVASLVAMSLNAAVRKVIIRAEGDLVSARDDASVMSAHTIVDRLSDAMQRGIRIRISYGSERGQKVAQYYAANPDGSFAKNKDGTRKSITREQYLQLTHSPDFRVAMAGPDVEGDRYYMTVGQQPKLLVKRRLSDGEIEEIETGDVSWDDVDTSSPPTAADHEEVRQHLAQGAAIEQLVPTAGVVSAEGEVTLVTPSYMTLAGNDIPIHTITSGPLPTDGSQHLLAVSKEIIDELTKAVGIYLMQAFIESGFSQEKTKEIIDAAGRRSQPAEAQPTRTADTFAAEIASGKKMESPEDLQYYENNKDAINAALKRLRGSRA